ncbi:hypothetical protein K461DRAFT_324775 [Myriangium duriaei CBS 260.36]|uniref:Uncharacterized protein n=1 Tax=Myriangium duriaei CBS 260.36 TaxID=1168546 RepID=A0A9P4MFZ8_9PEZI|nr:hypothetical protein K461DRAFT_324775 [Myriangium duriaei CBS 260.36]
MPDMKSFAKSGWHPSWDNKMSINRNNYKNPKGWINKGGDKEAERAENHVSAPLSSLRDPASFAPPPKHVNYHGEDAVAAQRNPQLALPAAGSSNTTGGTASPVRDTRVYDTDRGGWGGALGADAIRSQQEATRQEEEEANKPKPPPTPYRMNATGLRTDHLPPPPKRTPGVATPPPGTPVRSPAAAAPKPQPQLPPRLPRRQNSNPNEFTPPPPPSYGEATTTTDYAPNAASTSRLASAGVNVPGFGIGRSTPSQNQAQTQTQVSELQSRFAGLRTTSPASPSSQNPSSPLSLSKASSAFSTAQQARADPSSVSFSQARDAATTAHQVNKQYGAQIGAGLKAANGLAAQSQARGETSAGASASGFAGLAGAAAKKKAPAPPPPPKSAAAAASAAGGSAGAAPPPVPMGSKPRF